jgi:glycosyltransferase involved in cell wall biosynthesis
VIKVVLAGPYPWDQDDLYAGGVIHAMANLVSILQAEKNIELHVLTYTKKTKKITRKKYGNISCTYLPNKLSALNYFLGFRILAAQCRREIERIKPDLVHAQGDPASILAAVKTDRPHLVTIHGLYQNETREFYARTNLKNRISGLLLRAAERRYRSQIKNLISTTEEVVNVVKKYSPDVRVYRNNNPVDNEYFNLPNREKHPVILFVARITQRKGLHILLEAFARMTDDNPDCEVRIVGSESQALAYVQELKSKYEKLIRKSRISFIGGVDQKQIQDEISGSSVLCLPSLAESSPMVISQAMAAGKPVIASRVGGIPEMIESGRTGLLIEKGNVDELESAMRSLINNPELRATMGAQAKRLAKARYSPEIVAQKTVSIYERVITETKK